MGVDVVLPLLLLSLGMGLGTLGTVLWVNSRVSRLKAEQDQLRAKQEHLVAELEGRLEKLEAEVAHLRDPRGARFKAKVARG